MSTNDGGSAFPTLETETYHPQFGMSLRDYFAAAALTSMLSEVQNINLETTPPRAATLAYQFADAMLTERATAQDQQIGDGSNRL